jgi:hypothetical protein
MITRSVSEKSPMMVRTGFGNLRTTLGRPARQPTVSDFIEMFVVTFEQTSDRCGEVDLESVRFYSWYLFINAGQTEDNSATKPWGVRLLATALRTPALSI